ncbi:MAG: hypothetical protein CMM91_01110 [Rickettsiales bacterium]|nr:hypothetical protein [Rickettsiales bacterium]OUV54815.1 MAG: hypothetical protein CBC87_00550 [Rickettsiales bacterium TMED127]|tara:strand:+ start:1395 stop:2615 length:1221 start_codon:yes stop_codon:yes gene_type:complete
MNRTKSWYLFDFGLSSYPTIILTFFYGSFFVNYIADDSTVGSYYWGFTVSISGFVTIIIFSLIFFFSKINKISNTFFHFSLIILISSSFSLCFFDRGVSLMIPLFFIFISFIFFEILTLFYNFTLTKVSNIKNIGRISNKGWSFGYLGGLISLAIVLLIVEFFPTFFFLNNSSKIFLLVGPIVSIWILFFCYPLIFSFKKENFEILKKQQIDTHIFNNQSLKYFIICYLVYNSGVVSLFYFAGIYASNIHHLKEPDILLLGILINLFGIMGCISFSFIDDKIGSYRSIFLCLLFLFGFTILMFLNSSKIIFWFSALAIGFFIGPIQASSRSFLSNLINSNEQISIFALYSILGNINSLIGPFFISQVIYWTGSFRFGMFMIPTYFFLGLSLMYYLLVLKMSNSRKD